MVEYLRYHNGYEQGQSSDFDREYTLDPGRMERFIRATQPEKVEQTMCFAVDSQKKNFFRRLSEKIAQDGITNVLRKGFRFNELLFDLYYPITSEMNPSALDIAGAYGTGMDNMEGTCGALVGTGKVLRDCPDCVADACEFLEEYL